MQTQFSAAQLADPDVAEAEKILRACVHCGFCTATCPTYVLLGDELDSPRGRIYLIKDMLENDRPASAEVTTHIDRCLSCLGCMTTCPSGVHYMHLVDHARRHIEETFVRPWPERQLRRLLAAVLPRPGLFRVALLGARLVRPLRHVLPGRLRTLVALAPPRVPPPSPVDRPQLFAAAGVRRARVALLAGCAQRVLAPAINEATIRLLTRHGVEVVVAAGSGCCGALVHHLGQAATARRQAIANIDAWSRLLEATPDLDAVVINASGCGTMVKDYGFLLRDDPAYAAKAARIAALAKDVTEIVAGLDLAPPAEGGHRDLRVTYQSACSMQHGQKLDQLPQRLLRDVGYSVVAPAEAHLCCGSAGTYNLLQPVLATALRDRKAATLAATAPAVVASGNVGCMTQLAAAIDTPIVHTVELLDWATGGPRPAALGEG